MEEIPMAPNPFIKINAPSMDKKEKCFSDFKVGECFVGTSSGFLYLKVTKEDVYCFGSNNVCPGFKGDGIAVKDVELSYNFDTVSK
jgi:hypothetical protein